MICCSIMSNKTYQEYFTQTEQDELEPLVIREKKDFLVFQGIQVIKFHLTKIRNVDLRIKVLAVAHRQNSIFAFILTHW